MNHEKVQNQIKKAMCFTSLQWINQTRMFFERWAMIIADEHCILLEDLSRSESIWNWYRSQFYRIEELFYIQNRIYINNLGVEAPDELFDVFELLVHEIEEIYPITLINNLRSNGQRILE